jgi:hypothetical protein
MDESSLGASEVYRTVVIRVLFGDALRSVADMNAALSTSKVALDIKAWPKWSSKLSWVSQLPINRFVISTGTNVTTVLTTLLGEQQKKMLLTAKVMETLREERATEIVVLPVNHCPGCNCRRSDDH